MTDHQCACCDTNTELNAETEQPPGGQLMEDESVLDAALPSELQETLGRFLGFESIETLGEWAQIVRNHVGGSISMEILCITAEETDHWGTLDGDRYYFACFYDAVILAALTEQPVDIQTVSPTGDVIEARAVGSSELTVEPADAVFSFGIEKTAKEERPTLEEGYASICPYVKAFPDVESYERWAKRVPAATVAMPLAGTTELASVLVSNDPE